MHFPEEAGEDVDWIDSIVVAVCVCVCVYRCNKLERARLVNAASRRGTRKDIRVKWNLSRLKYYEAPRFKKTDLSFRYILYTSRRTLLYQQISGQGSQL